MDRQATEMTRGEVLLLLSPTAHANSVYSRAGTTPDGDAVHHVGGKVFYLEPGVVYPDLLKRVAADQDMELVIRTAMPLDLMEQFRRSQRAIPFRRLTDIWHAPGGTVFAVDPRPPAAFPGTKAYQKNMNAILASPP
jgi:hypothetical protein